MADVPADLRSSEATELAHGWVQWLFRSRGLRVLLIKGPGLTYHGLRDQRVSSDVDVLVHPADFEAAITALEAAGWHRRPSTFAADRYTVHSVTFLAPTWPCDVDVHSFYPGFLQDPGIVFDTLWDRRSSLMLANVECDIPDRLGAILILALHSLRSTAADPRHSTELRSLVGRAELNANERADLAALAAATGSDQTLSTVLPRLGVATMSSTVTDAEALHEWRLRVNSGASPAYMWLTLFRRAEKERLKVLRHAIWPSTADLHAIYPTLAHRRGARLIARIRRIGRGVRAIPRAIRTARRQQGHQR